MDCKADFDTTPSAKCVRDPFTAQRSAKNSTDLGSAIGKDIVEHDCRDCHIYCKTVFGRHALGAPFSPKKRKFYFLHVMLAAKNSCERQDTV